MIVNGGTISLPTIGDATPGQTGDLIQLAVTNTSTEEIDTSSISIESVVVGETNNIPVLSEEIERSIAGSNFDDENSEENIKAAAGVDFDNDALFDVTDENELRSSTKMEIQSKPMSKIVKKQKMNLKKIL